VIEVKRLLALSSLLLATGGCASRLPPPTEADALRASVRWPGTTVATLARGRSLYIDHCSSCHALHRPTELPPSAWPRIVQEMEQRSKLDADTAATLIRYLVVAAGAPAAAPIAGSEAASGR
jgi:hypothetical protein